MRTRAPNIPLRSMRDPLAIFALMTIELTLLAASVFVGIVHIVALSHLQSWQRGYRWTASSREQPGQPPRCAEASALRAGSSASSMYSERRDWRSWQVIVVD